MLINSVDGWMTCFFYVLLVISGQLVSDYERQWCNGTLKISPSQAGLKCRAARSAGQHLTHWATGALMIVYPAHFKIKGRIPGTELKDVQTGFQEEQVIYLVHWAFWGTLLSENQMDDRWITYDFTSLLTHLTHKSGVLGSIPGLATYFHFSFRFFKKGSCQLLAKVCARSTG